MVNKGNRVGCGTLVLDFAGIGSSRELHEYLGRAFGDPEYRGGDWNEFWQLLRERGEVFREVVLKNWLALVEVLPCDADDLLECLEDYRREFRRDDFSVKVRQA
ncbi:MAG: barstar family protein [Promethearchaeota archaeon]